MINCNASKIYQQDIYQVDKPLSNNGMDQKEIWRENLRALAARCKTKFIPKIKKVYQLILHLSLSIDIVHSISSKTPAAPLFNNPQIQRMAPGVRLAGSLRVETVETNPVNRSPDAQHEA